MHLIKSLRLATRLVAFPVFTLAYWCCLEAEVLVRGKKKRPDVINRWASKWARTNLWVCDVKVKTHGLPSNAGSLYPASGPGGVGRIFIMNHRSGLDILIMLSLAETHVISRHDLATWPLLGRIACRVGTLFVDRESRRSGASVLKEVARVLAKGEGVAMFPEGTAHEGDEVHAFRAGAFNAARRAGAEIIPLGIAYGNPEACYRIESFMTHMKRIAGLSKLKVAVEIGEPLVFEECSPAEMKKLARKRVQELVDQARKQLGA